MGVKRELDDSEAAMNEEERRAGSWFVCEEQAVASGYTSGEYAKSLGKAVSPGNPGEHELRGGSSLSPSGSEVIT